MFSYRTASSAIARVPVGDAVSLHRLLKAAPSTCICRLPEPSRAHSRDQHVQTREAAKPRQKTESLTRSLLTAFIMSRCRVLIPEHQPVALHVHDDGLALVDRLGKNHLRERVEQLTKLPTSFFTATLSYTTADISYRSQL